MAVGAELLGPVLLVHVEFPEAENREDLNELKRLAESGGGEVVMSIECKRQAPDPSTFIGSGKTEEVAAMVNAQEVNAVIFNSSLSPAQERNLEKIFGVRVMDRVALILLIFAQRARTYEGKLQVELAQLQYEQARLVRGWTHLERQKGGFGLRGGPGETQIELDRRALRERIGAIKKDLETVAKRRAQNRGLRGKNEVPLVSCVGYTNAGKSTLFNLLTQADVYTANQLFATLDPTLRSLKLPVIGDVVFADTVGFIRHLPHDLVAAFRGTLEETAGADVLLHIVDCSDPRLEENIDAVNAVLKQVGASEVRTLMVYNKRDLLPDCSDTVVRDDEGKPVRVYVSALTGDGICDLLSAISELLCINICAFDVKITSSQGRLRAMLYEAGGVIGEHYAEDGTLTLSLKLKKQDAARLDKYSGGALGRAVGEGRLPWAQEEFDFDSLN